LSYDLLKISNVKVFHSNQSVIQSLITNENSLIKQNNDVMNWFNSIKPRKQFLDQLNCLCAKSSKVLELLETVLTKTTLKVSRIRTENMLKVLKDSSNNAIFGFANETGFQNVKNSIIKFSDSQSILLKVINSLIPNLVSGNPVILIAEDKIAMSVAFVVDLCLKAGLIPSIIQFIITDNKVVNKIEETAEESDPPIFVIFESADVESSIDRISTSYLNHTLDSINVFVQQSLYRKLCERMKTRLSNAFIIGDKFDPKSDIESEIAVNYEAIDIESDVKFIGIKVHQFRTNEEAKVLINHFRKVSYVSLWAEKTSLALEFAININSSDNIYINSSLRYPLKKETSILEKVIDSVDLTSLTEDKNNQLLFKSMLDSQTK
jgi:hypothetical protein